MKAIGGNARIREASTRLSSRLEMWGGVECTINRVRDRYHTQLDRNGHDVREDDLERFASLGIGALRYPVLWEGIAPHGLEHADWSIPDRALPSLRDMGIAPIVGLVHHGSGPRHTSLTDPSFADGLERFARAVADRYPWIHDWTPVNEPVTTARFSCLYGIWYPHARNDQAFVAAVLNQCRATVLAMRAIRRANSRARLVQTDDISRTFGTEAMAQTVDFYNDRRWLGWDLLCGRVTPSHPLFGYLVDNGASEDDLQWFVDNSCPPDILGVNYYVTSDRWLDHRVERYPAEKHGGADADRFVDIEAVRVMALPRPGIATLLEEAWERYRIPVAVTEAHIDSGREDQMRWMLEIWRGAQSARRAGADVRAVTAWSLLGSFDWNCLLQECRGYYEPGPFDVRSDPPRDTALAGLIRELARGVAPSHPVAQGEGWWRRKERLICEPVSSRSQVARLSGYRPDPVPGHRQPVLISGATGSLGRAFALICKQRNIEFRILDRAEMDIADPHSVAAALERWRPWSVVNASGYVRIDAAESELERCVRENTTGPTVLARHCAEAGIGLLTFSSDQVFSGNAARPWLEHDETRPVNVYGRSKAAAERAVLDACRKALVVRTGAFFGPWDETNFLAQTFAALRAGRHVPAAADVRVSPTYLPDLVNVSLDLLIDAESGVWHLANVGDVSWFEFAQSACSMAGVDGQGLVSCSGLRGAQAPRAAYSVLASKRGRLMPTLEHALDRFVQPYVQAATAGRSEASAAFRKERR